MAGPLARSAADLKAALEVLGGPDKDQAIGYRWSMPPARRTRLRDYRLGYVLDDPLCQVLPEVQEVLSETVNALKKAGVKMEEGWPEGANPRKQLGTYLYLLFALLRPEMNDQELESARQLASSGGEGVFSLRARAWTAPYNEYLAALGQRMAAADLAGVLPHP